MGGAIKKLVSELSTQVEAPQCAGRPIRHENHDFFMLVPLWDLDVAGHYFFNLRLGRALFGPEMSVLPEAQLQLGGGEGGASFLIIISL